MAEAERLRAEAKAREIEQEEAELEREIQRLRDEAVLSRTESAPPTNSLILPARPSAFATFHAEGGISGRGRPSLGRTRNHTSSSRVSRILSNRHSHRSRGHTNGTSIKR